jgi:hypothetical protein
VRFSCLFQMSPLDFSRASFPLRLVCSPHSRFLGLLCLVLYSFHLLFFIVIISCFFPFPFGSKKRWRQVISKAKGLGEI